MRYENRGLRHRGPSHDSDARRKDPAVNHWHLITFSCSRTLSRAISSRLTLSALATISLFIAMGLEILRLEVSKLSCCSHQNFWPAENNAPFAIRRFKHTCFLRRTLWIFEFSASHWVFVLIYPCSPCSVVQFERCYALLVTSGQPWAAHVQ
jgi:hypothetical protein